MQLTLHELSLPLAHEFRISRSTRTHQLSLIVELSDGEHTGLGEVTANPYYGQTLAGIRGDIESVRGVIESTDLETPEALWTQLANSIGANRFAMTAIDLAAHDLFARQQDQPLRDLWGLDSSSIPDSSYTIGLAPIEEMVEKLRERPDWSCYKIKLGTDDDIRIVRALRQETDAVFRVDANCAWSATQAIEHSRTLKDLGVEFIEQPLPADADRGDAERVFDRSALPVIADESCLIEEDVVSCRGAFDGINIKLSKCGGLTPALRMLRAAEEFGLRKMVGCMVESSVGISAAAQLLPLLDYADLDGAVLLRDEPAAGVRIEQGRVCFVDGPGTGARLEHDRLAEFSVEA